ncbi:hypothetical protein HDU86_005550 [Geranomyces michiganensis]|nr:hypothetical protein HDU86_005550 [Geranomyces michiganensis]
MSWLLSYFAGNSSSNDDDGAAARSSSSSLSSNNNNSNSNTAASSDADVSSLSSTSSSAYDDDDDDDSSDSVKDPLLEAEIADALETAEFQLAHAAARPHLCAMQPLYLAESLNSKVEALRHDVLRARLIELILLLEFSSSYGENAASLTVAPTMDAATRQTLLVSAPVIKSSFPGPAFFPPLTRALFVRLFRDLPIFAGHGQKFLNGVDSFVEAEFLDFVGKWMRATKFDILSFSMHYVTLFAHLKNETWFGVDGNRLPLPREFPGGNAPPKVLPSSLYPDLQTYYRASLPGGGTFRLAKRTRRSSPEDHPSGETHVDGEEVFEMREFKARAFTAAWRNVFRNGCGICREMLATEDSTTTTTTTTTTPLTDDPRVAKLWAVVGAAPTVAELPRDWQTFFYSIVTAVCQTVDAILSDRDWRTKFANIWKRLPVNIMLTSLRLVNPVPFVDRVIKLFCWKPPGMHSLLQRIGGMIAASDKTAAKIKLLSKGLDSATRSAVEKIVDGLFEEHVRADPGGPHPTRPVSALDPSEKIRAVLAARCEATAVASTSASSSNGNLAAVASAVATPHAVAYAKLYIRKKEKDEFVESLGSKTVSDFITHVAKAVPPLLDEIWNCIDFASLMSALVDTVTQCLAALALYDAMPAHATLAQKKQVHTDVINALYSAILPFFKAAYPLLYALSTRKRTPAGLHALIEYLITAVMGPARTATSTTTTTTPAAGTGPGAILSIAKDTDAVTRALSPAQLSQLWAQIDLRVALMEAGTDPRDPAYAADDDVIAGPALVAFWQQIVREFVGDDNVVKPKQRPVVAASPTSASSRTAAGGVRRDGPGPAVVPVSVLGEPDLDID